MKTRKSAEDKVKEADETKGDKEEAKCRKHQQLNSRTPIFTGILEEFKLAAISPFLKDNQKRLKI